VTEKEVVMTIFALEAKSSDRGNSKRFRIEFSVNLVLAHALASAIGVLLM
jgi:hypothetical protein